jgi:hypothetical protein
LSVFACLLEDEQELYIKRLLKLSFGKSKAKKLKVKLHYFNLAKLFINF